MKKEKISKEEGGGVYYDFDQEEIEEILVDHLIEKGEDIPKEDVDVEYIENFGNGGSLAVTGKGSKRRDDNDDVPF